MAKRKVSKKDSSIKTVQRSRRLDDTMLIILGGGALLMILYMALLK